MASFGFPQSKQKPGDVSIVGHKEAHKVPLHKIPTT